MLEFNKFGDSAWVLAESSLRVLPYFSFWAAATYQRISKLEGMALYRLPDDFPDSLSH